MMNSFRIKEFYGLVPVNEDVLGGTDNRIEVNTK
jgi:hypothetical protein